MQEKLARESLDFPLPNVKICLMFVLGQNMGDKKGLHAWGKGGKIPVKTAMKASFCQEEGAKRRKEP
jgi:hypothetical protein